MPEFYGSQRLFWYLIVAVTLNSASIAVLTYFLVERAKAGSTAVFHFCAVFEYFGHVATAVAFLPVAVQFVGRWGLYRFVTQKFNIVPGHAYYDAFEDRKQPLELAAVLGGVAVACLA